MFWISYIIKQYGQSYNVVPSEKQTNSFSLFCRCLSGFLAHSCLDFSYHYKPMYIFLGFVRSFLAQKSRSWWKSMQCPTNVMSETKRLRKWRHFRTIYHNDHFNKNTCIIRHYLHYILQNSVPRTLRQPPLWRISITMTTYCSCSLRRKRFAFIRQF